MAGYTGHEHFYYRLAGAATLGYAIAPFLAYRERVAWPEVRIPVAATLTFNVAAVVASLISLGDGDRQFVVFFVLVAATAFSLVAAFWLRRDQGVALHNPRPLEPSFRLTIVVATAAAAFFGLAPLLLARPLASAIGFSTDDLFILRAAAAATLGYAVSGGMSLAVNDWRAIRLQTVSAIVFNGLSVVAAVLYLIGGGRSFVAGVILVAATLFTAALTWGYRRAAGGSA